MWGPPSHDKRIVVDDGELIIRENLWAFLTELQTSAPRTFWIDAISINQEDISERSSQVQFMGQIYNKASWVLVWLGIEGELTGLHLDILDTTLVEYAQIMSERQHFSSEYEARAYLKQLAFQLDIEKGEAIADAVRQIRPHHTPGTVGGPWRLPIETYLYRLSFDAHQASAALSALYGLAYWKRAWILQEILQAKQILLHCEDRVLLWSSLKNLLIGNYDDNLFAMVGFQTSRNSMLRRLLEETSPDVIQHNFNKDLHELVERYDNAECADVRDRIYSLLSLATDKNVPSRSLAVDYSQDVAMLFWQVLKFCENANDLMKFASTLRRVLELSFAELQTSAKLTVSSVVHTGLAPSHRLPAWHYLVIGDEIGYGAVELPYRPDEIEILQFRKSDKALPVGSSQSCPGQIDRADVRLGDLVYYISGHDPSLSLIFRPHIDCANDDLSYVAIARRCKTNSPAECHRLSCDERIGPVRFDYGAGVPGVNDDKVVLGRPGLATLLEEAEKWRSFSKVEEQHIWDHETDLVSGERLFIAHHIRPSNLRDPLQQWNAAIAAGTLPWG